MLGGWSDISLVVIAYVFIRIADRLSISWKKSADESIAKVQSELAKNNNTLNSLISFQTSSHALVQTRRLEAIQKVWKNVVDLTEGFPPGASVIINTLTVEEYEHYFENEPEIDAGFDLKWLTSGLNNQEVWSNYIAFPSIDFERPFIGEKMWMLYNLYRAFVWRLAKLFLDGAKERKFTHWFNDKLITDILSESLSNEELTYIYSNERYSYKNMISLLDAKMIEEINIILSGHSFAEDALHRVKRLEKIMNVELK